MGRSGSPPNGRRRPAAATVPASPMSAHLEIVADEWRERAHELARWAMRTMVNRTDVWGRYLQLEQRKVGPDGVLHNAVTAPFKQERGKIFLQEASLVKHFQAKKDGVSLGLHSMSTHRSSRWMAVDIDLHEIHDDSVTPEGNFAAALHWWEALRASGLDPLLMDSNGRGGFHLLVLFAQPMTTESVYTFLKGLVADFERRGLDAMPETFPKQFQTGHYGSWLRLPGRHHSRAHYTRVWNDDPSEDEPWLEGHAAIDRILETGRAEPDVLEALGMVRAVETICLDFDGVLHSYVSGWQGETAIPDPPIHGTDRAVERLRARYRVVVHSARCRTEEGREAVQRWLEHHGITVDEVCEHKPPATAYVDDRGVRFDGDWEAVMAALDEMRR